MHFNHVFPGSTELTENNQCTVSPKPYWLCLYWQLRISGRVWEKGHFLLNYGWRIWLVEVHIFVSLDPSSESTCSRNRLKAILPGWCVCGLHKSWPEMPEGWTVLWRFGVWQVQLAQRRWRMQSQTWSRTVSSDNFCIEDMWRIQFQIVHIKII